MAFVGSVSAGQKATIDLGANDFKDKLFIVLSGRQSGFVKIRVKEYSSDKFSPPPGASEINLANENGMKISDANIQYVEIDDSYNVGSAPITYQIDKV